MSVKWIVPSWSDLTRRYLAILVDPKADAADLAAARGGLLDIGERMDALSLAAERQVLGSPEQADAGMDAITAMSCLEKLRQEQTDLHRQLNTAPAATKWHGQAMAQANIGALDLALDALNAQPPKKAGVA